jgi:pimeloyl-ACP methyl ester carboxylesterase
MDVVLVPGLWLDASSWQDVPIAGHDLHPVTRSGDTLQQQIDDIVARVDALPGTVALVSHSGGGNTVHAVADARADRVSRVVYVDSWPGRNGGSINDELPVAGEVVPLPDWDFFDDAELVDLTPGLRADFRARAFAEPKRVGSDPLHLHDERRYDIPITIIACAFTEQQATSWGLHELARVNSVSWIELPTGHWPQFTKPVELGAAISAALSISTAQGIPAALSISTALGSD